MKIHYATRDCTRRGGSGRYSFNPRDGEKCWGCGGTGTQLTPEASRSREALKAFRLELLSVPATGVQEGDTVLFEIGLGKHCLREVLASGPDPLNEGRWKLECSVGGWVLPTDSTVRRKATEEERERIAEYARTLPGVTVAETPAPSPEDSSGALPHWGPAPTTVPHVPNHSTPNAMTIQFTDYATGQAAAVVEPPAHIADLAPMDAAKAAREAWETYQSTEDGDVCDFVDWLEENDWTVLPGPDITIHI